MKAIYDKLASVQSEISSVKKGQTNPFFNSKYFDINELLKQLKPVLAKNNLVLIQPLTSVQGLPALSTQVIDTDSGETITESIVLPNLQDPQKMGSAITYFRRYALQSFFALEAEDDDGNLASRNQVKTVQDVAEDRDPFETHVPIENERLCGECGATMKHKSGTGKTGKKWSGYFCTSGAKHSPIWDK